MTPQFTSNKDELFFPTKVRSIGSFSQVSKGVSVVAKGNHFVYSLFTERIATKHGGNGTFRYEKPARLLHDMEEQSRQ